MTRMPRPIHPHGRTRIPAQIGDRGHRRPAPSGSALAATSVVVQFVVMFVAAAIQPAAADETVAWAWVGELVAIGYAMAMVTALLTISSARVSLRASAGAAALGGMVVLGCPLTGHHELAGWWFGQLGVFAVGAVVAFGALRLLRADRS